MSSWDLPPDYPLNSDFVRRLKSALATGDKDMVQELICTEAEPVDAVIELANDDWMKEPSAQLPTGALLGNPRRPQANSSACWGLLWGGKARVQTGGDASLISSRHIALC
ncbi:Ankyrin repeat and SOCS box protein 18 [Microtus ochrogaster]|uniref:Ankyrin repeat and SOCS box protein 18 n=1 Tax=Microtus ochrogaster TaxID=79684 RepID=A0A8J6G1K5_MICOH|nr:Ankyrin repeat and SOCS box protein 18 [Microtus ochrogaster]